MTIKTFSIIGYLFCFSLCSSVSVFSLHLYLDSLTFTSDALSLMMNLANVFFKFDIRIFISSIPTWPFYSAISLLKIPFLLHILSTLSSRFFKILNIVVLKPFIKFQHMSHLQIQFYWLFFLLTIGWGMCVCARVLKIFILLLLLNTRHIV